MGIVDMIPQRLNTALFAPGVYAAVASLAVIIATWDRADRAGDKIHQNFQSKEDTFDFVVVGSGSAGAVVAYRLSEYFNVLLLEAGGEPHPLQSIPGFSLFMQNYPQIDWMHKTVPQKRSCFSCPNGVSSWSQGKNLGGSSNLNFMVHSRGNFRDFDNWAKITGDPSWSYDGLLPYFKRYEDFYGNTTDPYSHGVGGQIRLEVPDYRGMADEFIWAANELGYPQADLNGRYSEGYDHIFYPIKKGVRSAVFQSYIQPGRKRASLTIRKFAHVNRVLTRGKYNEAYAVEYDRHGETKLAYARKEIILSAGAVQSPKILMLSGIGPWEHLKDMGIPKVADLPVGKNLQDHVATYLGPFFIDKPRSFLVDREVTPKSFADWALGRGPLTTSGFQAAGYITSSLAKERGEWDWPDVQHLLFGMSTHKTFAWDMSRAFGIKEDVLTKYYAHALGKEAFSIITSNGRPVARGEVLLGGKNPYDPPQINPRYFEDPWDMDIKVTVEAIQIALKMIEETRSFASLNARFTEEKFPGCEKYLFRSNEYFECYLRQYTVTLNHAVGTCAMGAKNSPHTVVDPDLRVLGVGNLRVIDASVMPTIVGGNTQAATIAIGEKGASMILDYWKNLPLEAEKHGVYAGHGNSYRPGLALLGIPPRPLSLFSPKVKPVFLSTPLYDHPVDAHVHAHAAHSQAAHAHAAKANAHDHAAISHAAHAAHATAHDHAALSHAAHANAHGHAALTHAVQAHGHLVDDKLRLAAALDLKEAHKSLYELPPAVVLKDSHNHNPKSLYGLHTHAYRVKRDFFSRNNNIRTRLRNVTLNSFPVEKGARALDGPYGPDNVTDEPLAFSQVLALNSPLANNKTDGASSADKDSSHELIKGFLTNSVSAKSNAKLHT